MRYRVLLVAMVVIALASAPIGFFVAPDELGPIGGFVIGVMLDLVLGLTIAIVAAVIRVAAGSGVRTHHRVG